MSERVPSNGIPAWLEYLPPEITQPTSTEILDRIDAGEPVWTMYSHGPNFPAMIIFYIDGEPQGFVEGTKDGGHCGYLSQFITTNGSKPKSLNEKPLAFEEAQVLVEEAVNGQRSNGSA